MTERKNKKPESARPAPGIEERQYVDAAGIPRVALLPKGESDVTMGIPISLDVSSLYEHMPESWVAEFTTALHAQGLVKPQDFFVPGAGDRFRAAMLTVIRHDYSDVLTIAKAALNGRD